MLWEGVLKSGKMFDNVLVVCLSHTYNILIMCLSCACLVLVMCLLCTVNTH